MKKFWVSLFLCLLAVPAQAQMKVDVGVPAEAGRQCYTHEEAEAEQGIRIHSELMVIALNCQHMTPHGRAGRFEFACPFPGRSAINACPVKECL